MPAKKKPTYAGMLRVSNQKPTAFAIPPRISCCTMVATLSSSAYFPVMADVQFRMGNEKLIRVKDGASARLRSILERQGRPSGALRVAVVGGGCSGLQYKMDLVDGPANRDIMVESNQVRVVVDPKSALFVSGSELDFSDDLQKGGFKVTNPNAVAHCSCGESFSA
jgi:iron-sulfur cluster assembly accessory protein